MRRSARHQTQTPGHDSFLDIVANIVGILIILVIVAGLRVRNATVEAASSDASLQAELEALNKQKATAASLRSDVFKVAAQIQQVTRETLVRQAHRDRLAAAVAAWEQKIQSHRSRLDAGAQEAFDIQLDLSDAKGQLEELHRRQSWLEADQAAPIRIESYPTPLSKTVDDHEAHFHLRAGRVTFIPMEELLEAFKADAQKQARSLLSQLELTDTVGPVGGFRLRYTLQRREMPHKMEDGSVRLGTYATLKQWTLIPVSGRLGEPVEAALAQSSRFRQALSELDPKRATVTIWTYPDSFAEFGRLKKELYHLGFPTAARPLPHGIPIGGSPQGTKSAAE